MGAPPPSFCFSNAPILEGDEGDPSEAPGPEKHFGLEIVRRKSLVRHLPNESSPRGDIKVDKADGGKGVPRGRGAVLVHYCMSGEY